jgi:hypothetical protein
MKKRVIVIGGGTFSHVRTHLALAAPAFGKTAKSLYEKCNAKFKNMDVELILTKMADSSSNLVTNEDVSKLIDTLVNDNSVKVIFFNVALCDFNGYASDEASAKYATRLETSEGSKLLLLTPSDKIINKIRKVRKDIFVVGFKTTSDATPQEQFSKGLKLMKNSSANIVLANDVVTRNNFIITPEEGVYGKEMSRDECLDELVDIAYHRTHLSFTRSTVVAGSPIPWSDERVPSSLRTVINWCVEHNAYKEFNGATTGHFAAKLGNNKFLTSIRKTNFNEIENNGMVLVETDGDDNVIAYGYKPSVGGQSQRIIFERYDDCNSIVHFHCPLLDGHLDNIPVVSQREYECGSHQCGENTANGLSKFGNLYCVMLDNHGPNIVFNDSIEPQEVIDFILNNFDLNKSTSGFEKVYLGLTEKTL